MTGNIQNHTVVTRICTCRLNKYLVYV